MLVCNWQARLLTRAPKSDLKTSDVWLFCGCARESKVWLSSVGFALVDQTHTQNGKAAALISALKDTKVLAAVRPSRSRRGC